MASIWSAAIFVIATIATKKLSDRYDFDRLDLVPTRDIPIVNILSQS